MSRHDRLLRRDVASLLGAIEVLSSRPRPFGFPLASLLFLGTAFAFRVVGHAVRKCNINSGRLDELYGATADEARASAARASSRVESSVGSDEFASLMINGISVQPSITASQPSPFRCSMVR